MSKQVIPNEGLIRWLQAMVGAGAGIATPKVHLLVEEHTPARTDTYAILEAKEADADMFPGYAPQNAAGAWDAPTVINGVGGVARTLANSFVPSADPPELVAVYGVFVTDAGNTLALSVFVFDDPVLFFFATDDPLIYTVAIGDRSRYP